VLLALAGCGFGPVTVPPHDPQPGTAAACADLVATLPDIVDDAIRRDVDPPQDDVAAWGRPPIVLRCGVGLPADYLPDAQLLELDGVAWFASTGAGGTFFTTIGRDPAVEVAVPDAYDPAAGVLLDLAPALSAGQAAAPTPS
jgi:hypothetical protein